MVVVGVSRAPTGMVPLRRGASERGFRVRAEAPGATPAAVGTASVTLSSLLAMQEVDSGEQRDREAQRHGEAVLDGLSELQSALLGSDGPDLGRLARLVERPVSAADPGLAGVLRAVRLRAEIELARRAGAATV